MANTFEKIFFFLPYLNSITKFWQLAEIPIEMIYVYLIGGIVWLFFSREMVRELKWRKSSFVISF